jgi:carboxylesterase type B
MDFAQYTRTWAYEFAHRTGPGLTPEPAGYVWGAGHAAELAYLFPSFDNGTPIAPTFDAGERRLAAEMNARDLHAQRRASAAIKSAAVGLASISSPTLSRPPRNGSSMGTRCSES